MSLQNNIQTSLFKSRFRMGRESSSNFLNIARFTIKQFSAYIDVNIWKRVEYRYLIYIKKEKKFILMSFKFVELYFER